MLVLSRTRISIAVLFALTALLVVSLVAPAAAKGRPESAGKSDKAEAPAYTEDNDTNDGNTKNNVADASDNVHPSGKDRSVEHGGSGNQGKAQADPDDDGRGPERTNGGVDQPNGPGGVDKADQDSNNGCGNDDDFEDDNEGHCGRAPAPTTPTKPTKPSNPGNGGGNNGGGNNGGGNNGGGNNGGGNNGGGNNGGGDNGGGGNTPSKIGICHRTGSMTNPYVFIDVSTNGTHGHEGHDADVIGAPSAAACPNGGTTPTDPADPTDDGDDDDDDDTGSDNDRDDDDDTDVGGVIIVRPPVNRDNRDNDDKDDNDVIIVSRPRRDTPAASRTIGGRDVPARVLASTGSRTTVLASIAALALLMGGGLLGIRRFVPKQ